MVHGAPDYGIYHPKSTVAALEDLAEAVVRLGGISTFDRRGDVVYCDDYESPIERFRKWSSGGCSVNLDSQYAHSKAQSALFSTGGVATDYCVIYHYLPPYPQGKHGIKISTLFYEMVANASYYRLYSEHWNGAFQCRWGLEIDPKNKKLYYNDADFARAEFEDDFTFRTDLAAWWNNIKLVADLTTGKYVRLLINNREWDMSAYSFRRVASTTAARCRAVFVLYDEGGHAFTCWQDDFVYTINEP